MLPKLEKVTGAVIVAQGNYFEKDMCNLGVSLKIKLLLTNSGNLLNKTQLFIHLQQKEIPGSLYLNTRP